MKRTGTCTQSIPCVYEAHVNEISITQNSQLVMLPTMHFKNEIEPNHVLITF